jgi:hypothetical protein
MAAIFYMKIQVSKDVGDVDSHQLPLTIAPVQGAAFQ